MTDLIECVKAKTCKNAVQSTINWADVGGIPVLVFTDTQSSFALYSREGELTIWFTKAGDRRASQMLTVFGDGHVVSAELGPQPGENFPMRMTPEQTAEKRKLRKAYHSDEQSPKLGSWGEEYKSFWQEQADGAVAAIRRQIAK